MFIVLMFIVLIFIVLIFFVLIFFVSFNVAETACDQAGSVTQIQSQHAATVTAESQL